MGVRLERKGKYRETILTGLVIVIFRVKTLTFFANFASLR